MNKQELEEIVRADSFSWIKIKKFNENPETDHEIEYRYENLLDHHKTETSFLIGKCRELAARILELENENNKFETLKGDIKLTLQSCGHYQLPSMYGDECTDCANKKRGFY
jgi:hypothetical protein